MKDGNIQDNIFEEEDESMRKAILNTRTFCLDFVRKGWGAGVQHQSKSFEAIFVLVLFASKIGFRG